jgi:hypothetical protein
MNKIRSWIKLQFNRLLVWAFPDQYSAVCYGCGTAINGIPSLRGQLGALGKCCVARPYTADGLPLNSTIGVNNKYDKTITIIEDREIRTRKINPDNTVSSRYDRDCA